jgi:UDP-N-acetylglucosamine:LPS N-acetylglucosamine transferase
MNQLLRLLEKSGGWPAQPMVYITTVDVLAKKLAPRGRVYVVGECNRYHPLRALSVFSKGVWIVLKERPDVVITTGSLPLAIVCLLAKLFGARIVWIDSIANIDGLSMSGQFARHFADLLLTQWPELAKKYKKVEYAGALV